MPVTRLPNWQDIQQKPNTLNGFGITDAGNIAGTVSLTSNTTLTVANSGRMFAISAANLTIQINTSGLPVGARFWLIGNGGNANITRVDGGAFVSYGITTVSNVSVQSGDGISFVWDGNSLIFENYGANMALTRSMQASLGTSGWQRLPSGLILQWGSCPNSSGVNVTLPIAFPSVFASVTAVGQNGGGYARANVLNLSTFYWNPGTSASTGLYMAIGY